MSPREILRRTVLVFYFRWGFLQDVEMHPFMSPKIKVTLMNKADIISKTCKTKSCKTNCQFEGVQLNFTDERETDRERARQSQTDRERGLLGIVPYDFHTTDAVFILYITHTLK